MLINKNIKKKIFINKISVIIPVFNCENSIISVIRSIQNQNLYEFEIILVNDNSTDNTTKIIKKLKEEDNRIKTINNKKNMGILYSRCIGVLEAKGKYIFPLDNDDMFFDKDLFETIYNDAIIHNYDIVGFKHVQADNYNANIKEMKEGCHMHNYSFIIYQPELSLFGISKNDKLSISDVHIWSKCIKNYIYKTAVNTLGEKKYSLFISWAEDTSMVFILFNIAKSYRYITKYGIFRLNRKSSASNNISKSKRILGAIFLLDIIFIFTKNNSKDKKFVFYIANLIGNIISKNTLDFYNKNYLNLVLSKIYNCTYINTKDKEALKNIYKNII